MSKIAAEKPAFREAMRPRRCLVLVDGFYEWKPIGLRDKQPYTFSTIDDSAFAFAGLWERWRDPSGKFVETCTILTAKPNSLVADDHDRMPVIVRSKDYDLWLDPGVIDGTLVADYFAPFDASLMKKYPVSSRGSHPANDDEECAREIRPAAIASPCSKVLQKTVSQNLSYVPPDGETSQRSSLRAR